MAKKSNTYIFSRLVKDKDDIQGHIAYAIYKFEKVSHIEEFKKEHKREPNAEEKEEFRASCCNPARLEEYQKRAEMILDAFSNELLNEAANQIEADYIKKQDEHLKDIVQSSQPTMGKQYLNGILQSMIGTFLMAFIVWGIVSVVSKHNTDELFPPQGSSHQTEQVMPQAVPTDSLARVNDADSIRK